MLAEVGEVFAGEIAEDLISWFAGKQYFSNQQISQRRKSTHACLVQRWSFGKPAGRLHENAPSRRLIKSSAQVQIVFSLRWMLRRRRQAFSALYDNAVACQPTSTAPTVQHNGFDKKLMRCIGDGHPIYAQRLQQSSCTSQQFQSTGTWRFFCRCIDIRC